MAVQDQIFEWVQKFELWKQELFRRASASPVLAEADVHEVIAMLLGESGTGARPREVAREDLPGADSGDEPMLIESLSDLRGVNAIEDGQAIRLIVYRLPLNRSTFSNCAGRGRPSGTSTPTSLGRD